VNHGELGPNNKDFSFHGLCRFQSFDELEAGQAIGKETYKDWCFLTDRISTQEKKRKKEESRVPVT